MKDTPEGYDINQAYNDVIYLGMRQAALEDAIEEWSEFITAELLKQGIRIHKNKRSFEYFKGTLNMTHKQNYERFESLFKYLAHKKKAPPNIRKLNTLYSRGVGGK